MTVRVLLVHNSYRQRGGEDAVFEAERDLLADAGHDVDVYTVGNAEIAEAAGLGLALRTVWSRRSHAELRARMRRFRPDVAHFHNTLPLISPSGYYAAWRERVPVVQTLHNYRLICPAALLFRDGGTCEACVGRSPWRAVRHGCYRGSRAASAAVAAMLVVHRLLKTWQRRVDRYLALTDFARDKMIAGGLPAGRVEVLPNCLAADPGAGTGPRQGLLFAGRLSEEKGVRVLLHAMRVLRSRTPLRFAGDGPLAGEVRAAAAADPRIDFLGPCDRASVLARMRDSALLVVPSTWYEGQPMTVIEAFASGLPVAASNIGGLGGLVDAECGARFDPGDAAGLARRLDRLLADPAGLVEKGRAARARFERDYCAAVHRERLVGLYERVVRARRDGHSLRIDPQQAAPA